jgi:hypothetical protein
MFDPYGSDSDLPGSNIDPDGSEPDLSGSSPSFSMQKVQYKQGRGIPRRLTGEVYRFCCNQQMELRKRYTYDSPRKCRSMMSAESAIAAVRVIRSRPVKTSRPVKNSTEGRAFMEKSYVPFSHTPLIFHGWRANDRLKARPTKLIRIRSIY